MVLPAYQKTFGAAHMRLRAQGEEYSVFVASSGLPVGEPFVQLKNRNRLESLGLPTASEFAAGA